MNGCNDVLGALENILDKYGGMESGSGPLGNRMKRVWKKLIWEPKDIVELRDRISSNVTLLDAFLGQITR